MALSSCMISPLDEQPVEKDQSNNRKPVQFAGAVPYPNQPVTIEALETTSKSWIEIDTTTSTHSTILEPPMYLWSAWVKIEDSEKPEKKTFWGKQCAAEGKVARVRSRAAMPEVVGPQGQLGWQKKALKYSPLMSFREDVNTCLYQGKPIKDCAAPESPVARVVDDYRDFGQECFEHILHVRLTEGPFPVKLQRYQQGECCADGNAEKNVKGKHLKKCPDVGPQNECPGYDSLDKLLSDCIWKQQYLDEMKCYDDHYPDCLNWPIDADNDGIPDVQTPCTTSLPPYDLIGCAHYRTMIDSSYTSVACGFYKTPSGKYWSVQNFYK